MLQVVLLLNDVYSSASVSVNGEPAGSVLYAPYELDITEFLAEGENEIFIAE